MLKFLNLKHKWGTSILFISCQSNNRTIFVAAGKKNEFDWLKNNRVHLCYNCTSLNQ